MGAAMDLCAMLEDRFDVGKCMVCVLDGYPTESAPGILEVNGHGLGAIAKRS